LACGSASCASSDCPRPPNTHTVPRCTGRATRVNGGRLPAAPGTTGAPGRPADACATTDPTTNGDCAGGAVPVTIRGDQPGRPKLWIVPTFSERIWTGSPARGACTIQPPPTYIPTWLRPL